MPAPSKRDKQSLKRSEQNRSARTKLRSVSKNFYRALEAGDLEGAKESRNKAQKTYANAASRGVIHRNKAARKISRLDKALQKATG